MSKPTPPVSRRSLPFTPEKARKHLAKRYSDAALNELVTALYLGHRLEQLMLTARAIPILRRLSGERGLRQLLSHLDEEDEKQAEPGGDKTKQRELRHSHFFRNATTPGVDQHLAGLKAVGATLAPPFDLLLELDAAAARAAGLLKAVPALKAFNWRAEKRVMLAFLLLTVERLGLEAPTETDLAALAVYEGYEPPLADSAPEFEKRADELLERWKVARNRARKLVPGLRDLELQLREALGHLPQGDVKSA